MKTLEQYVKSVQSFKYKDTRTTSVASFWCFNFFNLFLADATKYSVVNFEQVNAGWVVPR